MCYMVYSRFISFRLIEKIPTRRFERSSAFCLARTNGIRFCRRGNDAVFLPETPSLQSKILFHLGIVYISHVFQFLFYFYGCLVCIYVYLWWEAGNLIEVGISFHHIPLYAVILMLIEWYHLGKLTHVLIFIKHNTCINQHYISFFVITL